MLGEEKQGPGQCALAGLERRSEQGWYLSNDGGIARRISVGVGTIHDDRGEAAIVNLSAFGAGPFQNAPLEHLGLTHDAAIACDGKIDPKSESAAAQSALL